MQNIVSLKDVRVNFDGEPILNGINLDIKDKEFVTFLVRQVVEKPQLCVLSVDF